MSFSQNNPWIPEREATVCLWKADYNRGYISNMNASLLTDFMCLSNEQISKYVDMLRICGFTGIQVTDMVAAWRASGSWQTVHDRLKFLADEAHKRGMRFTLWCWAAAFSGHGWHDADAVYENADPSLPACHDPRVLACFNKYYDIYADLAPYADRVIAHFFDPGYLRDMESILYFTRLLAQKFRAVNPNVQIAVDTWGCPEDYPSRLVEAGMPDVMLMELPFLPSWRSEGKRAQFRKGVRDLGCDLGSWGWYTCEYEIDQFPFMSINNRVLKDVYNQTREQADYVITPSYWSEMDSYHILNFFSLYAAGHLLIDPTADPDRLLRDSALLITGSSCPGHAQKLLAALELIRDARSGDKWNTYWWQEKDYILLHGNYEEIFRCADKVIADFESLIALPEPKDGMPFPLSRSAFYRLILPHLYQIRQFAAFRHAFSELQTMCETNASPARLQRMVDALPFEIPEYNCVTGLWGQPEARIAHQMTCDFCAAHRLHAPERAPHVRNTIKRRYYDALCVQQRGLDHPHFVSARFYEGGKPFGESFAAGILEEMIREDLLIQNEEGRVTLKNWQDFRFDFNI